MELRLEKYIGSLELLTDIKSVRDNTPQAVHHERPETGLVYTFVCSKVEPTEMVLPLNVVWVDFNPESPNYGHALRRLSKDKDPVYDYAHTWEVLYFYDDIWTEQYFDPADLVNVPSPKEPDAATVPDKGIGLLSTEEESSLVIGEGDETLTNARDPLEHESMHEEDPATMVSFDSDPSLFRTVLNVPDPNIGMTLILEEDSWSWDELHEADLLES